MRRPRAPDGDPPGWRAAAPTRGRRRRSARPSTSAAATARGACPGQIDRGSGSSATIAITSSPPSASSVIASSSTIATVSLPAASDVAGRLVLVRDRELAGRAVVHAVLETQRRQQAVALALVAASPPASPAPRTRSRRRRAGATAGCPPARWPGRRRRSTMLTIRLLRRRIFACAAAFGASAPATGRPAASSLDWGSPASTARSRERARAGSMWPSRTTS